MSEGGITLQFLGAAGCVTGSRFLLTAGDERLLVDCGQFQGEKELRLRNWEPLSEASRDVAGIVLTHAHIDHSGLLPRYVGEGWRGPILATPGTCDLLRILLPDAAHLQEEEAYWANKRGYSKHAPALPLFTARDAEKTLGLLRPTAFRTPVGVGSRFRVEWRSAGHILGSAVLVVEVDQGAGAPLRVVFSGDLGRYDAPILRDPAGVTHADVLVIESTYGGRRHTPAEETVQALADIVNETVGRRGTLLIPAFAVGRTQTLLYVLRALEDTGRIPRLPVFVDSPMAIKASEYYLAHREEHDAETCELTALGLKPLVPDGTMFCPGRDESKRINQVTGRAIIISASGMMTGGRILHHAAQRLPDKRNTILLAGYQSAGTRGRRLADGETELKVHGELVPVRARVAQLDGLSAHADEDELVRWAGVFRAPPRQTFVVHGEPEAASALAERLKSDLGFEAHPAAMDQAVRLA
jgi:metallo-beta-lactamase family protein